MGRSVFEAAAVRADVEVAGLVGPNRPDWEGADATAAPWFAQLDQLRLKPDLLIDFTLPVGTAAAAAWCGSNGVPLVSGVTGLDADARGEVQRAAASVPVLWSPNLSVGVNLLADLVRRAADVVGREAPVSIDDIHHQWKKDAPSGTALMLGAAIAGRRGGDDRGITYHSTREGEIIGEHRVRFALDGEEIELAHRAADRGIFARGALEAGLWLVRQPAGFYSAADWLAGRVVMAVGLR